jgi:hypothetical protein
MTDDQFEVWAEASISHRSPRDGDVEALLHQQRHAGSREAAAFDAENVGGPVERYLTVVKRCATAGHRIIGWTS